MMHGSTNIKLRNFKLENMTERENLGDLGVDGVIKLQLLSKNGE
jgi:hypothetical protein